MDQQKILTITKIIIVIIITITAGIFLWEYKKSKPAPIKDTADLISSNKNLQNKTTPSTPDQKNSQALEEVRQAQELYCSEHKNEQRLCDDSTKVGRFSSSCSPIDCSRIIDGEKVPYISSLVIKDDELYFENQYNHDLAKIESADIPSFKIIGTCASMEMSRSMYEKDKNSIYINNKKLDVADVKTFEYLGSFSNGDGMPHSVSIAKDTNHIYFNCGAIIDSIDKKSFEILGNGYSKDKKQAFYLDNIIDQADAKTFKSIIYKKTGKIYGNFALDKNHLFFEGAVIKDISPSTCVGKELATCLPDNWRSLVDYSTLGKRLEGAWY